MAGRRSRDVLSTGSNGASNFGIIAREEFAALSAALQRLQGRFILSLNDVPDVRELFAWATIKTVELSYQAGGGGKTKRVREVVISA